MIEAVHDLLERFKTRGVGASKEINPFWRAQLAGFGALLKSGTKITPRHVQKVMGYTSSRMRNGESNRDLEHWPRLMNAVETRDTVGLGRAAEHAAILHFLGKRGLLDDYIAWADGLGLVSDLGLARMYWYATRLRARLVERQRADPQVFLEVGCGSGRFAMIMAKSGLVRHYILVDLPEMLLNAMLHTAEFLPGADIRFGQTPDLSAPGMVFWFLETDDIRKVPDRSVDVAVNFNSFMEMDEEVRDFYIDQIYRAASARGLFYNVNRFQREMTRRDGTSYDNNPLLYPYRASDRIIEWETDDCQESCRSEQFVAPRSFSISRIAEIGGAVGGHDVPSSP